MERLFEGKRALTEETRREDVNTSIAVGYSGMKSETDLKPELAKSNIDFNGRTRKSGQGKGKVALCLTN
jgi:hypothetical protein